MVRVGIVGATGYSGAELIRLLSLHPHVKIARVYSSSTEGEPLGHLFPHLESVGLSPLEGIDPEKMCKDVDVVFLATPAGVSAALTPQLLQRGLRVIDLSGDFRLGSADVYRKWYQREPAPEELLTRAVYGLSEWNREQVASAELVANPGCYPTAALLGMLPLVRAGWVHPHSWIVDAKSGVSGAGRGVSLGVHYSEVNESIAAYKVGQHQHTPEIEQELYRQSGTDVLVQFTPHLVPMTRGILVTAYGQLEADVGLSDLQELYQSVYEDQAFVRLRKPGTHPRTKEVYGSNYCDISMHLDKRTGRIIVLSVIDNMVKGAAGQAVQNLNIMQGWPETTGLPIVPLYP